MSGHAADAPASRPPNVIFILMDDMGARDLGCTGSRFFETPNIDALAASGMQFTSAYAACPVCSPTRASILTGKYPARLGLTDWLPGRRDMPTQKLLRPEILNHLPLEEDNLARALKGAGYRTGSIGKWHLGGPAFWPEKQGFDVNVGGTGAGSPPGGYFNFRTPNLQAASPEEYLTDRLTAEAEKFIEASRDRPFFLYLPYYAVHIPLQAKEALVARYREKARPGEPQNNPVYAAIIQSVDEGVGRILRKLDDLKLADRTAVFFTSDNGGLSVKEGPNTPATSNAPFRAGKGYLYEGGIREPLIVRWPGVTAAGSRCEEPVSSMDFYPTILEMAGVSLQKGQVVDGVSVAPLLKGGGKLQRQALYWHYPHYSNQGGKPGGAVRADNLKLIQFYEDDRVELYDLAKDVSETKDLAAEMPAETARLKRMLEDWRRSVGARMPSPNPDYK